MTNQDKFKATKQTIIALLQASGPCTMPEIIREVKQQAFAGYTVKALCEMRQSMTVRFCAEDQCFEMFQ